MYRLGSVPRQLNSGLKLGIAVLKHIALRYKSPKLWLPSKACKGSGLLAGV